jgi:hypothetical protein
MPPRINKIVEMRKYAPIAKNGNAGPLPDAGGLLPVALGGGRNTCGLTNGPKKSASGICPKAIASATTRTITTNNLPVPEISYTNYSA